MSTHEPSRDGSTTRICGLDEVVETLAKAYADSVNHDGWMTPERHRDCTAQAATVLRDVGHFNFGMVTGSAFHHLQKEAAHA